MKKIMLSALMLAGAVAAFAQDPVVVRVNTSTYPAMTVPYFIRADFETKYPGMTVIAWEPVDVMWRASYNNNNRLTHVYYNDAGVNYTVTLPVINGFVSEDVISKAIALHGNNLATITMVRSKDGSNAYRLGLLENGMSKTVWMNSNGSTINQSDVYKVKWDEDEMKVKSDD